MKQGLLILLLLFLSCDNDKKEKANEKTQVSYPVATKEMAADREVVCFVYHRFGDDRYPSTNISSQDFEAHLSWLKKNHYQVLNLSDAIRYLKSDEPIKRTAVITIDDGYNSFFENGLPLLNKYVMPATLFINTKTVGAGDYMDWDKLKKASNQKVEIGNHTHSHAYFLNEIQSARYAAFLNDIELSQKIIKEKLNLVPQVFAYPYGEWDEEMKTIVKALGFVGAAAQNSGVINAQSDFYQMPRFPMSEAYANKFEEKAKMKSFVKISASPTQSVIPKGTSKPQLTLTIDTKGIVTDQMECYIQGSECEKSVVKKKNQEIVITIQAMNSIKNRRTLYTLTAPDTLGNWHWFSHLWINPSVK